MDAYALVMVMCACTSRDLVTEGLGLFAVACHALLDRHRIAAEVRHEGLALLGLARDDARVGVVDDDLGATLLVRVGLGGCGTVVGRQ